MMPFVSLVHGVCDICFHHCVRHCFTRAQRTKFLMNRSGRLKQVFTDTSNIQPATSIIAAKLLQTSQSAELTQNMSISKISQDVKVLTDKHNEMIDNLESDFLDESAKLQTLEHLRDFGPTYVKTKNEKIIDLINSDKQQSNQDQSFVNFSIPVTSIPCSGCGALLHCHSIDGPGFMPADKLKVVMQKKANINRMAPDEYIADRRCLRCDLLTEYKQALKMTISDTQQYIRDICGRIKQSPDSATILFVVDVLDLPGSIIPNLYDYVGNQQFVIVGNKADLLVNDSKQWHQHIIASLKQSIQAHANIPSSLIRDIKLVSAYSGYGIEGLIDYLLQPRFLQNHETVYILGCTNVGKSTLFNTLLSSDFCKSMARDYIGRATTSVWPGTTLNLLKFPIVNFTPRKYELRLERLQEVNQMNKDIAEELKQAFDVGGIKRQRYVRMQGHVGQTFASPVTLKDKFQDLSKLPTYSFTHDEENHNYSSSFQPTEFDAKMLERKSLKWDKLDERKFSLSSWCFDTPGFVNSQQIINYLSSEELNNMFKCYKSDRHLWIGRTFILRPGLTLLLGTLGRLELVDCDNHVYFTCHTSLPIHIVNCEQADIYVSENRHNLSISNNTNKQGTLNTSITEQPNMSDFVESHKTLPDAIWHEFSINICPTIDTNQFKVRANHKGVKTSDNHKDLKHREYSLADVVFSSCGWVSVTPGDMVRDKKPILVRAYWPEACGCVLRSPAILPFAVKQRGCRILGTREFKLAT